MNKTFLYLILFGIVGMVLFSKYALLPGFRYISDTIINQSNTITPNSDEEESEDETPLPENLQIIKDKADDIMYNPYLLGSEDGKTDCNEGYEFQYGEYSNTYTDEEKDDYDRGYESGYYGSGCIEGEY